MTTLSNFVHRAEPHLVQLLSGIKTHLATNPSAKKLIEEGMHFLGSLLQIPNPGTINTEATRIALHQSLDSTELETILQRSNIKGLCDFAQIEKNKKYLQSSSPFELYRILIANCSTQLRNTMDCMRFLAANIGIKPSQDEAAELRKILDQKIATRTSQEAGLSSDHGIELIKVGVIPSLEDVQEFLDRYFIATSAKPLNRYEFKQVELVLTNIQGSKLLATNVANLKALYDGIYPHADELIYALEQIKQELGKAQKDSFVVDRQSLLLNCAWKQLDVEHIDLFNDQLQSLALPDFLRQLLGVASIWGYGSSKRKIFMVREGEQSEAFNKLVSILSLIKQINKIYSEKNNDKGFVTQPFIHNLQDVSQILHPNGSKLFSQAWEKATA